ncbi:MAG TPA: thiamine pyrophosphate-binding protein, partial [Thermomicrobiales bacterium]|nr:thiamine pyrophosphate-binding protein [Thermomicrobiales bacterium]
MAATTVTGMGQTATTNGRTAHAATNERPVLTGSEITCRALEAEGVTTVFGYPGGAVIPLYDALPRAGFKHVLVRFEQWAAL